MRPMRYLAAMPEIDDQRIVLMGFSYGGMATLYAAHAQLADALAPDGPRFAAHVAFYAPCVARFVDRRTTGAPVMMLMGGRDALTDPRRCAEVAEDLTEGGSAVRPLVFADALHQWDGAFDPPREIGRNLAPCSLQVDPDGMVRDRATGLVMRGPMTRRAILALCVSREGYLIGRDDAVRTRSNAAVGDFLVSVLADPAARGGSTVHAP